MSGQSPLQSEVVPAEPVIVEWDLFDIYGADFVLKSIEKCEGAADIHHIFTVHKVKLSTVSSSFADMFSSVDMIESLTEEGDNKPAPEVIVTESPAVIEILVASVYNEQNHFDLSQVITDWQLILDVYEAANKYGMYMLKAYAQSSLSVQCLMGNIKGASALQVYTSASMYDDGMLAEHAMTEASKVPLHKSLSTEALGRLSSPQLLKLVQAHLAYIGPMLDRARVQVKEAKAHVKPGGAVHLDRAMEQIKSLNTTYFS